MKPMSDKEKMMMMRNKAMKKKMKKKYKGKKYQDMMENKEDED